MKRKTLMMSLKENHKAQAQIETVNCPLDTRMIDHMSSEGPRLVYLSTLRITSSNSPQQSDP